MKPQIYNSFEEIDNHLKILKLKREIDKECLKLHLKNSKIRLNPINIVQEFRIEILKQLLAILRKYSLS
jgi:hypothetical protein